ncbi:MAG: SAM-dependent methyltransferase [Parabacteroides sp.]|nr:SAM-dependent methyltransferase [bacterium]MDD7630831.1 SAM-dependent methyltransferase [bacterium]MDY4103909.1 SAM-dependent methyltransferase [Parabacteroides sp.]MDY4550966.1 SAM-dependent methyltransferase [Parabacteroides sp.]MDY6004734.1 SAM-dependent methyltransferase [Parabacteroides sp.]
MTPALMAFIQAHLSDDPDRLLLSASRYPEIDMPFVVAQITARRQIKEKLPTWYQQEQLLFPAKIAAEQCSSEQTALYKQQLVTEEDTLCDLTGGLGIDSYYFSRRVKQVYYIERFPSYCEVARANMATLGARNVAVLEGDSTQWLDQLPAIDVFYVDPARRGEGNKRMFALSDCEPDLTQLLPRLLAKAPRVIAKLSPMADLRQTLALLPTTQAIHILSVKNECKELLFVIGREPRESAVPIHCVHLTKQAASDECFVCSLEAEQQAASHLATTLRRYLYEPNASVLKAGAFKQVACQFPVEKLQVSSHLYTSDHYLDRFPGRRFEVDEVIPFHSKSCKQLAGQSLQANVTTRNFPLTVEALRKKCRIREGGDIYLFATTGPKEEKLLIRTHKVLEE